VKKKSFWAGLYLAVVLAFSQTAFAGTMINGAGATFPYPVYSAWAYNYNKVTGVKLNYQAIGSGGGQRQIFNRTVDFGASDAPLTPEKLKEENLYQFPAVMGGVVLIVNIPGIRAGQLRLDPEALTKIFLGKITFWDDKKLKTLNPTLRLPRRKITVVHRSDGSGTTAIFTTYLSQVSVEWKKEVGHGVAVKWPVGIGGKGNQGVANYVQRIRYSIGYVEFAYAEQNKLTYTLLKNSYWNFVTPNFKSFQDAAASANFDPRKSFYLWLVNSPGENAWPIAGATFILLAKEKKASNLKVVKFYDWAFKNGDETAKKLIYVPLPESLKDTIRSYWRARGIY